MQGTDQRRTSKHARWKLHALKSRKLGGNKDKLSFLGPSRNEEIMKPAALTLVQETSRLVNFLLLRAFSRRSRESGGDSTSTPPPPRQASRRATASAMSEPQPGQSHGSDPLAGG